MTSLSQELEWRGFVNQMTFGSLAELDTETRTFYWGVDPSADSMTIGNLAPAMMVRHFIDHGYRAVLLVGGATGLIGDPDGKKQERDLKSDEQIAHNVAGLVRQYQRIFDGQQFEIVNNRDWFDDIKYLEFLREVGKNVSMTQLLDRDFIRERIGEGGSGISYAEFSYALIQGYDFLHLYRDKGVTLQVAGADQWGNSITGVDLIRKLEGGEAHVFTAPLVIDKATGVKFGKSEAGAVWLDPAKTSPYQFYQFWLNCDDTTSADLIKIYTLLDQPAIESIIDEHAKAPENRLLQRTLAQNVTDLVHGIDRRQAVEHVTAALFSGNSISTLSDDELDVLAAEIPTTAPDNLVNILASTGTTASSGDAKRLIKAGAISVNGVKVDADQPVAALSLVKKGKNSFILVR